MPDLDNQTCQAPVFHLRNSQFVAQDDSPSRFVQPESKIDALEAVGEVPLIIHAR